MRLQQPVFPDTVHFGRNSFDLLPTRLSPLREGGNALIFLLDPFFSGKPLHQRIPVEKNDLLLLPDISHEPSTAQVDQLVALVRESNLQVGAVVGIGGGSIMDLAKSLAIMLNNPGSAADYQGWDLVRYPAVYKIGIPTLCGTGAEVTRTAVLNGPRRKLGINSDHTPFDELILDPELTLGAPAEQRFYTGMDCFIHCVESLGGKKQTEQSTFYSTQALSLCREVFYEPKRMDACTQEKLILASYAGGMGIMNSQVGVVHAMSYGLGYVLGIRHGLANCLVMDKMDEYYPAATEEFRELLSCNGVTLPSGVCRDLDKDTLNLLTDVSLGMRPLWENALGDDWEERMPREKLRAMFSSI